MRTLTSTTSFPQTASLGQKRTTRMVPARVHVDQIKGRALTQPLLQLSDLPSEPGLPVLGNLLYLLTTTGNVDSLHEKHGPRFMLNQGVAGGYGLYTSKIEDIETILTNPDIWDAGWTDGVKAITFGKQGHLLKEAQPWRSCMHAALTPALIAQHQLPKLEPLFKSTIERVAQAGPNARVLWYEEMWSLAYQSLVSAAIGPWLSAAQVDAMKPEFKSMTRGTFFPNFIFEKGIPFTPYRKGIEARERLVPLLEPIIRSALNDLTSEKTELLPPDCVVSALLKALADGELPIDTPEGRATAVAVTNDALFLLFAGTDTSAMAMSKALSWLWRYPEWLERLQKEQDALIKEHGSELNRKVLAESHVALAIAQEALRLTPPVPILPRKATRDTTLGDLAIPGGTLVTANIGNASSSTGAGIGKFDPGHWLRRDGSAIENKEPGNWTLGGGMRKCVGRNVAMMELMTTVALIGRYVSSINMDAKDADCLFQGSLGHPTGMPVSLTAR